MTPQDFIAKWGAPGGVPGPAYGLNEEQGAKSHFLDFVRAAERAQARQRCGLPVWRATCLKKKATSLAAKPAMPMYRCVACLLGRTKGSSLFRVKFVTEKIDSGRPCGHGHVTEDGHGYRRALLHK
ncbi:MAG: hypothetical protein PHX60_11890 [Giesbergeria sp.]|uniref:hypothetical protein n=1 Tax=Giesbergeria sp. TaxID=2818473 RepID=UPI00260F48D1|nr:hypothetical protein [Giesbergeria sp.]MDD2610363.1 hypothetical protein [Giesbergeria sp.]